MSGRDIMKSHKSAQYKKYNHLSIKSKMVMMDIYDVVGTGTPFRLSDITKVTGKPIPPGAFANLKRSHCVKKHSETKTTRGDRPIIRWVLEPDFAECIEIYGWRERLAVNDGCLV